MHLRCEEVGLTRNGGAEAGLALRGRCQNTAALSFAGAVRRGRGRNEGQAERMRRAWSLKTTLSTAPWSNIDRVLILQHDTLVMFA